MKKQTWTGAVAMAILLMVGMTACGSAPATRYYLLDTRRTVALPVSAPAVWVEPFTVDPPYDQDRVVYRVGSDDVRVRFYPYDRWAVPLQDMVADLAAAVLDGAGGARFQRVAGVRVDSFSLRGRLVRLEEIDLPSGPHIRFRLDLALADSHGKVIYRRRVENETAVSATQVEGVVRQMQAALLAGLEQVRPEIAAALAEAEPGS
ncbi:MAG: hypothetical protein E2P00_00450 [Acidobacteria bacterium]|nr:MAG: hypothetical protein E2P03_06140 [Acidobacteriota bacterium]TDI47887.1 MAG: hypothetical protein E2P00_00450 [Acidobacteriota bacterium]